MAEITGFTASRMKQIENETVINGYLNGNNELVLVLRNGVEINTGSVIDPDTITGASIIGDNLIMSQRDGGTLNLGNIRGPQGIQGVPGNDGADGVDGVDGVTDHGALTGLGDDDHAQYLNNARGDARYPLQSAIPLMTKGTYSGMGSPQTISLPFTPTFVLGTKNGFHDKWVMSNYGFSMIGAASQNTSSYCTTNGFYLASGVTPVNVPDASWTYIAWKV